MNARTRMSIAVVALALALGAVTASAHTAPPHGKVHVVGTVAARDEAAGTFTLAVKKKRARTLTVRARRIPAVGSFVLVKGIRLDDGTIQASRVKLLRGGDRASGGRGDHGRGPDGEQGDRGRGRGPEDRGDRGHGRGPEQDRGGRGRGPEHT